MDSSDLPETHFAQSGDVSIAYQVIGDGPADLVIVPGIVSHLEAMHDLAGYLDFLRRLSRFSRVAIFDKRGQGLSDRVLGAPTLEERADDVRAVMDALGRRSVWKWATVRGRCSAALTGQRSGYDCGWGQSADTFGWSTPRSVAASPERLDGPRFVDRAERRSAS